MSHYCNRDLSCKQKFSLKLDPATKDRLNRKPSTGPRPSEGLLAEPVEVLYPVSADPATCTFLSDRRSSGF